jgi:peptidoglycan hydrolase-like protein with peptidoglycan-binding domain
MKINPKIAKSPDELKNLEFKKMKVLIKKELKRLEKYSSATAPTPFFILGEFDYVDKPAMALPIFGVWKGKFKEYAKKEVVKDKLGAIGTAYYGGIDESGQKNVHLNLAKGLGKNKSGKLERILKKLIPQATYNVVFSEIDESVLDKLETILENAPEVDENFDEHDSETVLVDSNQDAKKLLISNFKEIIDAFKPVKEELIPRLKSGYTKDTDFDIVTDLDSLADEWLEICNCADDEIQALFLNQNNQVIALKKNLVSVLSKLKTSGKIVLDDFSFVDNLLSPNEKPDSRFEIGLSKESLDGIFIKQGLKDNCDATARMIVYNYLLKKGIAKFDYAKFNAANANKKSLMMKAESLNQFVQAGGYEIERIYDGFNTGNIKISQEENGKFVKSFAFEKALKYIDANLKNAVPVVAGIGIPNYSSGNPDSSDHFIVIVGKSSKGYYYLDPAAADGADLNQNILENEAGSDFLFKDPYMRWTANYSNAKGLVVLTNVAVYPKDKDNIRKVPDCSVMEIFDVVKKGSFNKNDVQVVQSLLFKDGYNIGAAGIDGDCGDNTHQAILAFQKKNKIEPANGIIEPDSPTWFALKGKPEAMLNPEDVAITYEGAIMKISSEREKVLKKLLATAGEASATIINTFRSETEQAAVMFENLKGFGPELNKKQYKTPAAAVKVVEAYQKAVNEGVVDESKLKAVILSEIKKVGASLLSGHCDSGNPAVDILPSSINNRAKFLKVMQSSGLFSKLVAPPKDSSFHLEFK